MHQLRAVRRLPSHCTPACANRYYICTKALRQIADARRGSGGVLFISRGSQWNTNFRKRILRGRQPACANLAIPEIFAVDFAAYEICISSTCARRKSARDYTEQTFISRAQKVEYSRDKIVLANSIRE